MRRLGQILTVSIIAISASGCVTHDAYLSGTLVVRILDAKTRLPIEGAKVAMRSQEDTAASAQAVSDSAGLVTIPPLRGSMTWYFYGDRFPKPVTLTVDADTYRSYATDVSNVGRDTLRYYGNPLSSTPPAEILLIRQ